MKQKNRCHCHFWRWLILSVVRIPKLYVLAWGILILLLTTVLRTDMAKILASVLL